MSHKKKHRILLSFVKCHVLKTVFPALVVTKSHSLPCSTWLRLKKSSVFTQRCNAITGNTQKKLAGGRTTEQKHDGGVWVWERKAAGSQRGPNQPGTHYPAFPVGPHHSAALPLFYPYSSHDVILQRALLHNSTQLWSDSLEISPMNVHQLVKIPSEPLWHLASLNTVAWILLQLHPCSPVY